MARHPVGCSLKAVVVSADDKAVTVSVDGDSGLQGVLRASDFESGLPSEGDEVTAFLVSHGRRGHCLNLTTDEARIASEAQDDKPTSFGEAS